MTVINTNVGALTARTYATQANDSMQTVNGAPFIRSSH